jgi:prophage maintenance system killer protein
VKNHPFADGNKRSAVALAAVYLDRNGVKPFPPNTLAVLTLVAASSDASEKDQIIGVLRTVIARNNV